MKLHIASDLHLEHARRRWPGYVGLPAPADIGAQVLVLAGDISNADMAIDAFEDWPCPVIYVPGNHEFYGQSMPELRAGLKVAAKGTSVHVLDNDVLVLDGIRFVGSTLWTDYALFSHRLSRTAAMDWAEANMADHRWIDFDNKRFSARRAQAEHRLGRDWLKAQLDEPFDGKTVVISHHAPSVKSVASQYANDNLTPAFASNLEDLLSHPALNGGLWVHGHTHNSSDYTVGGCRVVANPRGYPLASTASAINQRLGLPPQDEELSFENRSFQAGLVLEI